MKFYRAYHVDFAGITIGHMNFQAKDDQAACINAYVIKKIGNWPEVELWANERQVECPAEASPQRGHPWGRLVS